MDPDSQANREPDLEAAQVFLDALGGTHRVQVFDDTKLTDFADHFNIANADDKRLVEHNRKLRGVFVMVNEGDGKGRCAANVVRVRVVCADLDGAPLDNIGRFPLHPHFVIESSPGRYQVFWLVKADFPLEDFGPTQTALATLLDGDGSVKDRCRVMRLPGFFHCKGEPFLTRIVERWDAPRYSTAQIESALKSAMDAAGLEAATAKLASTPRPRPKGKASRRNKAYVEAALTKETLKLADSPDGEKWVNLRRAAFALGGLPGLDCETTATTLVGAIEGRCKSVSQALRTARSAFEAGALRPREIPDPAPQTEHKASAANANGQSKKGAKKTDSNLTEIILGVDEERINLEIIKELSKARNLFQRAGSLVMVSREAKPGPIIRPNGASHIAPIAPALLRERAASVCKFLVPSGKGKKIEYSPSHPPQYAINAIHARRSWSDIRPLEALVEYPVLRPNGTLLARPGYDPDTGLLLLDGFECADVPESPTKASIEGAIFLLSEAIADFPFAAEANRSAWIAGLLTILGRHAFEGCAPLTLIDANTRGSGKGLLVDALSLIATGREMPRTPAPKDDDEYRKSITAIAMAGDPVVLIDNVVGMLGCPALDAALTATVWKARILGKSENTGDLPLKAVWFATGNNIVLGSDTARRVLHVRLLSPQERPEERKDFKHPNLKAWIKAKRPKLLAAALTILRGFCAAGRPDQKLTPWGSFEGWSDIVRQAVVWSGLADPADTRMALMETADRDSMILRQLLEGIRRIDSGGLGLTAKRIMEIAASPNAPDGLAEAVDELATGRGGKPTPRTFGMRLEQLKERVCGDMMLTRKGKTNQGQLWRVVASGYGSDSGETSDSNHHLPYARERKVLKGDIGATSVTTVSAVTDEGGDVSSSKSPDADSGDDPIAAESI